MTDRGAWRAPPPPTEIHRPTRRRFGMQAARSAPSWFSDPQAGQRSESRQGYDRPRDQLYRKHPRRYNRMRIADVAQLVEQLIRNQQVVSSSLTVGSMPATSAPPKNQASGAPSKLCLGGRDPHSGRTLP